MCVVSSFFKKKKKEKERERERERERKENIVTHDADIGAASDIA